MKKRLDVLVFEKGFAVSREKARSLILSGNVIVDGNLKTKCGEKYTSDVTIRVKEIMPYVSRGALKLEKAIKEFNVKIKNKICVDIGSSTGGFTEILLHEGAEKVYAVDVGTNQLAYKLRKDKRVIVMEKTNVKDIKKEMFNNDKIELAVIDVSFISLTSVLEPVLSILNKKNVITLVKPQFEVGNEIKNFKGVVKDNAYRLLALERVVEYAANLGLNCTAAAYSPISGPKGNLEFFLYLTEIKNSVYLKKIVERASKELE